MSATTLERFTFTLPADLVARLGERAEEQDRSKIGMLRQILQREFSNSAGVSSLRSAERDSGGPRNASPPVTGRSVQANLPVAALSPETVASSPRATASAAAFEHGLGAAARLHDAHARRQADAKDRQEAEHAARRSEAIEGTLGSLRRISQ